MEYLVAALVLLVAVGYAVVIAVNVEKGKPWALEIAQAVSMLDPASASHHLRERALIGDREPEKPAERALEPETDRLAA